MVYMKSTWKGIFVRLTLYAAMLLLLWHIGMLNTDNALAMANMAWLWHTKTGSRETLLFALGISFFAGCDYAILVRTFAELFLSAIYPVYTIATFIVWTCYIPAQVLLLRSYAEKIMTSDSLLY